jgi:hypothetical protein
MRYAFKLISSCLVALAMLLGSCSAFAEANFVYSNEPPPGFDNYNPTSSGNAQVYLGASLQPVGAVPVQYDNNTVRFNPQLVIALLNVKPEDKALVSKALSGPQAQNYQNLCKAALSGEPLDSDTPRVCTLLTPQVAAVIFNPSTLELYVFVNSAYLNNSNNIGNPMLPASTAGFSYMMNNQLNASYNTAYSEPSDSVTQILSLNTQHDAGYGDSDFKYTTTLNYTDQPNVPGSTSTNLLINNAYYQIHYQGQLYQAGMISFNSNNMLLPSPQLLGASIQNDVSIWQNGNQSTGSPVIVYLTQQSQVRIIRNDNNQLLYSQSYPAGKYQIDTQKFPEGVYNISIQTTGLNGQTTSQQMVFYKNSTIPSTGSPNYMIAAGALQRSYSPSINAWATVAGYSNNPAIALMRQQAFAANWDATAATILSNISNLYSLSANYLGAWGYQATLAQLLSSKGAAGSGLLLSYSDNLGTSIDGSQTSVNFNSNILDWYGTAEQDDLLNINKGLSLTNSVNFNWRSYGLSLSNSYQYANGQSTSSYGLGINKVLLQEQGLTVSSSLSLVSSSTDRSVTLGLNISLPAAANIDTNINSQFTSINSPTEGNSQQLTHTATANYTTMLNQYSSVSASLSATGASYETGNNQNNNAINGNVNFNSLNGNASLSGYASNGSRSADLSAMNTLVYANGHIANGISNQGWSGVLLDVSSPTPVDYTVYDNQQSVSTGSSNWPLFVSLQEYKQHSITISPLGSSSYNFNANPKNVVLYYGNVQNLQWALNRQLLLVTRLVDNQGNPLPSAVTQDLSLPGITNATGYLQINLPLNLQQLTFTTNTGNTCVAKLPTLDKTTQSYIYIPKLSCLPIEPQEPSHAISH